MNKKILRVACIASSYLRDTQVFAGSESDFNNNNSWFRITHDDLWQDIEVNHYIGVFEGENEDDIKAQAASIANAQPYMIILEDITPQTQMTSDTDEDMWWIH